MKAILIKEAGGYDLYRIDEDGKRVTFASTQDYKQKLSLKNCQAIERGYDLDELVEGFIEKTGYDDFDSYSYKLGFQKALELMGNKKFSEDDMYKMFIYGRSIDTAKKHIKKLEDKPVDEFFNDFIQSLQQTEWDVEVTMKFFTEYDTNPVTIEHKTEPKLDADGYLILKRV